MIKIYLTINCKQLLNPIHKELRASSKNEKEEYQAEFKKYHSLKNKINNIEKPIKPKEKMLFIPANNSATGASQLLSDNDGRGLIFETAGATLAQAFNSDYGNYSDGLRKAFHHETISYYRRTDREYVDIESPRLSAVLSATPMQVSALIPNAENGLFSRFIFYYMDTNDEWKNVFANSMPTGLDSYFNKLSLQYFDFYNSLKKKKEISFKLTSFQEKQFNEFFEKVQTEFTIQLGEDYIATIRRLGLIAFRIAMILTSLRTLEKMTIPRKLICSQVDFDISIQIVHILMQHASKVFEELPKHKSLKGRNNRSEKFLKQLPYKFNRARYLEVAQQLSIPAKTAEGYITKFIKEEIIHRESQDNYINSIYQYKDSP